MMGKLAEDIVVGIIYAFFVEMVAYTLIFLVTFFVFPAFNPGAKVYLGWITAIVNGAYDMFILQLLIYGAIAVFSWELSGSPVLRGVTKRSLSALGVATTMAVGLAGYIVDTAPLSMFSIIRAVVGLAIVAGIVGGIVGYVFRKI